MIIKAKKNIEISWFISILKVKKYIRREDVVKFLKGKRFEDNFINNRIIEYLRNLDLIEKNSLNLTSKGQKVIDTHMMEEIEFGKYKIWYIDDRPNTFFNNKVIYLERVKPINDDKIQKLNIPIEKEGFWLSLKNDKNNISKIEILPEDNKIYGINEKNEKNRNIEIHLEIADSNDSAVIYFSGEIETRQIKKETLNLKNINKEKILKNFFNNLWDEKSNRLKVKLKQIKDNIDIEEIQNFYIDTFIYNHENNYLELKNDFYNFDYIEIKKLPIKPFDIDEAKKIIDFIYDNILESNFYSIGVENKLQNIIYNKALSTFSHELYDYIFKNDYKKRKIDNYFSHNKIDHLFHLVAYDDLNPDNDSSINSYLEPLISLELNKTYKFEELTEIFQRKVDFPINYIIYYDRYVFNEIQQRIFLNIIKNFNNLSNITLITLKNIKGQNNKLEIVKSEAPNVRIFYIEDIFKENNKLGPHNRYFMFFKDLNQYSIWESPSSLNNFIYLDNNNPDKLKICETTNISKVKYGLEVLDPTLTNFIKEIIQK